MSTAVQEVVIPRSEPLPANKTDRRMLAVFIFLAVFELPIIWIKSDSIGLFDLYLLAYDLYLILRTRGTIASMPWAWQGYFLVFFGYIAYLSFHVVMVPDFRSAMVTLKTGETMVIMITLYVVFTRFQFEPRAVAHMLAISGVLLGLFQLGSFFHLFSHFGFGPGFGIGQWYRVGLPFVKGVSSDPAGAVAGLFVLVALFAHRKKDMRNVIFYPLVLISVLALVLTVSRTNILSLTGALVVYLLLRSFKRSRYLLVLIVLIVVLATTVSVLVDRLSQDSELWKILNLVRHPSQFFSRVGSDSSFALRYQVLWPAEYKAWIANASSFLFGNGVAYFGIADNTYLGVLTNQGLIGLVWFFYVWYLFFFFTWRSNLALPTVVFLFLLVGGITGDTLVTTYRVVQVYLPILFFLFYAYGGLRGNHDSVGHRPLL